MAIMPGATLALLPENETQATIIPTQLIYHTAVDQPGPTRLERYFARQDVGLESHFWVRLDGEIVQMMNTEVRADANRRANRRLDGTGAISIETEDEGDPIGRPWTPAQMTSLILIARWVNEVHEVPFNRCAGPSSPGQGYHAMWGAPSDWTPSHGKTCPGSTRIRQFEQELLPALNPTKGHLVNKQSANRAVESLYRVFLGRPVDEASRAGWVDFAMKEGEQRLLWSFIGAAGKEAGDLRAQVKANAGRIAELQAEVVELGKRSGGPANAQKVASDAIAIIVSKLQP